MVLHSLEAPRAVPPRSFFFHRGRVVVSIGCHVCVCVCGCLVACVCLAVQHTKTPRSDPLLRWLLCLAVETVLLRSSFACFFSSSGSSCKRNKRRVVTTEVVFEIGVFFFCCFIFWGVFCAGLCLVSVPILALFVVFVSCSSVVPLGHRRRSVSLFPCVCVCGVCLAFCFPFPCHVHPSSPSVAAVLIRCSDCSRACVDLGSDCDAQARARCFVLVVHTSFPFFFRRQCFPFLCVSAFFCVCEWSGPRS